MSHEYMLNVLYRSNQTFTSSTLEFLMSILDFHVGQIYDFSQKMSTLQGVLILRSIFWERNPKNQHVHPRSYQFCLSNVLGSIGCRSMQGISTQRQTRGSPLEQFLLKF